MSVRNLVFVVNRNARVDDLERRMLKGSSRPTDGEPQVVFLVVEPRAARLGAYFIGRTDKS